MNTYFIEFSTTEIRGEEIPTHFDFDPEMPCMLADQIKALIEKFYKGN